MARMNLFDRTSGPTEFEYDAEADTLYVSFGLPRPAVGIDIGEGVIVRYDEKVEKVVGITMLGIGARVGEARDRRGVTSRP
jgi:uncharacterized protein YuzE